MNRQEYMEKYNHDNKERVCPTTKKEFKTSFTDHDRVFTENGKKHFLFFNSCKWCNKKFENETTASLLKKLEEKRKKEEKVIK